MPGSIEFSYPRPNDPALEFQRYGVCFVVDCDSQHGILCGNHGAKVSADTLEPLSALNKALTARGGDIWPNHFGRRRSGGDEYSSLRLSLVSSAFADAKSVGSDRSHIRANPFRIQWIA